MKKYQKNLNVHNTMVFSYNTLVAVINHETRRVNKVAWCIAGRTSSPTTSKHINYVASELGYEVA